MTAEQVHRATMTLDAEIDPLRDAAAADQGLSAVAKVSPKVLMADPAYRGRWQSRTLTAAEMEEARAFIRETVSVTVNPGRSFGTARPSGFLAPPCHLTHPMPAGMLRFVKRVTGVAAGIALAAIAVFGVLRAAGWLFPTDYLCPYSSPIGGPSACSGPLTTSFDAWIKPRGGPGNFTISVRSTGTAPISPTCHVDGFDAHGDRVGHGDFPLSKLPVDFPHVPPGISPGTVVDAGPASPPGTKIRFGPVAGTRVSAWSGDEIMSFYGHLPVYAPVASFKVSCSAD